MRKGQDIRYTLESSYKRAIKGKTLTTLTDDFTDKLLTKALYDILGNPGFSAGQAENGITSGNSSSAYTGAQSDPYEVYQEDTKKSGSGLGSGIWDTLLGGVIGVGRDLLGYYHADKSAEIAYDKQNEFYLNHQSLMAKADEMRRVGVNPMSLAGAGVGSTSTPTVQAAQTPSGSGIVDVLGQILNYKAQMAQVKVDSERNKIQSDDVASKIELRAEQRYYQQLVNDWYEANQVASISKLQADTADALQRVKTGESQEELNRAGVTKEQAEAALLFQEGLQKMWENTPAYRNATINLMNARSAAGYASAKHQLADIENLAVQRSNIAADTLLKYAQTDVGKQQLINMGYEADKLKFDVDHQNADRIWNKVEQTVGMVTDVAGAVGDILTPIKIGSAGKSIGGSGNAGNWAASSSGRMSLSRAMADPYGNLKK